MVQNRDIATLIYDTLAERILNLDLMPGCPIYEADICDEFEASRTPVRTAMQRLSDKGLLDILPYRNNRISLIDTEIVSQLIYSRAAVEERVIRDFIELQDPLLVEDVEHMIRKQTILIGQDNFKTEDFFKLDSDMHRIWFNATGRNFILDFFYSNHHYSRMRMLDMKKHKDYKIIIKEHEALYDMIRNGAVELIHSLVYSHLSSGFDRVMARADNELRSYLI
ncbi:MAG: GntR family transcriptional regulator [Sphaerochaetaceae bacterium]|nr:GntR family transcriptional regulator [Sphaerochaetaceae bacterium]